MSSPSTNPPLPSPPFHTIPNIANLRDPTLYPLRTPTGPLRPTILFRSADVSKLTRPDCQLLRALGIAHVFDLRSLPEVTRGMAALINDSAADVKAGWMEALSGAGIERSWVPVFSEKDYSPEGMAARYVKYMDEDVKGFVDAYADILRSGGSAYGRIFRYLANLSEEEVGSGKVGAMVHCTAGKDRTGMFFGILFEFLGVERSSIAAEYNLTEMGLRHVRDEIVGRLMQSPAFKAYMASRAAGKALTNEELSNIIADEKSGGAEEGAEIPAEVVEVGRRAAVRMVGARKESMIGALEMLDREFGGAEKYMRDVCGLSGEEMERLRRNLVIGEGDGKA